MKIAQINPNKAILSLRAHWLKCLLILIGVGIRLVLAGATVHPDLLSISAGDFLLTRKGVVNIYEYLAQAPASERAVEVYGRSFFTYPPLAYFTLGFFNFLLSPLFSYNLYARLLGGVEAFSGLGFDTDLLVLKFPYLIFDLLMAILLFRIFEKDKKKAWMAFFFWVFNPVSWYTSFMIGQFDIIPTFLVVLSVYFALREKKGLAVWSLGVGASLKMFPLFFLPILILVLEKNIWQRLKLSLIGILSYLITMAPFLRSSSFCQTVLFSGQSQKMLFSQLPVSGAEGIYLFVLGVVLIYLYAAYFGKKRDIWQYYFWILLLFFSVTHYHPQWFLWIMPFLIWMVVESDFGQLWLGFVLVGCWLTITLLFESSLSTGLFAPVFPQLARIDLGSLANLGNLSGYQIKSLARSVSAATSLWLVRLGL